MDTQKTSTKHDSLMKIIKKLSTEIEQLKNSLATDVLSPREKTEKKLLIERLEFMIIQHSKEAGV